MIWTDRKEGPALPFFVNLRHTGSWHTHTATRACMNEHAHACANAHIQKTKHTNKRKHIETNAGIQRDHTHTQTHVEQGRELGITLTGERFESS